MKIIAGLFLFLIASIANAYEDILFVEIPDGEITTIYGIREVTDNFGSAYESQDYETQPVKIYDQSGSVIAVKSDQDKAKLFASIKALDEIKDTSYSYYEENNSTAVREKNRY